MSVIIIMSQNDLGGVKIGARTIPNCCGFGGLLGINIGGCDGWGMTTVTGGNDSGNIVCGCTWNYNEKYQYSVLKSIIGNLLHIIVLKNFFISKPLSKNPQNRCQSEMKINTKQEIIWMHSISYKIFKYATLLKIFNQKK